METIIYKSLRDFRENYFIDFSIQNEYNMLQYLSMLKKKYNCHIDNCRAEYDKNDTTTFKIIDTLDDLEDYLPYHGHYLLKNDLHKDFNRSKYTDDDFIQFPELIGNCMDIGDYSHEQNKLLYEKISLLFT
jgi:hypothetical protein